MHSTNATQNERVPLHTIQNIFPCRYFESLLYTNALVQCACRLLSRTFHLPFIRQMQPVFETSMSAGPVSERHVPIFWQSSMLDSPRHDRRPPVPVAAVCRAGNTSLRLKTLHHPARPETLIIGHSKSVASAPRSEGTRRWNADGSEYLKLSGG